MKPPLNLVPDGPPLTKPPFKISPAPVILDILERRRESKKRPYNKKQLAGACGMSPDLLGKKLRGERGWRYDRRDLIKIAEALGVPLADLIGEEEPEKVLQPIIVVCGAEYEVKPEAIADEYLAVPLVEGRIAAGYAGVIPGDYVQSLVWVYRPEIGRRQQHNLRAVKLGIDQHSMVPTIRPGDIVIIDPEDREITHRGIYAVRLDSEGGCAIKRVQKGDNFVILFSDNPDPLYAPMVIPEDRADNLLIGRVIWSWTSWVRNL